MSTDATAVVTPYRWLSQTKFAIPQLDPDTLARPELIGRLQSAVAGPLLTLISAPAGSGKTTLLVQ